MLYEIFIPAHQNAGGEYDEVVIAEVEAVDEQNACDHLVRTNKMVTPIITNRGTTYWWNQRNRLYIRSMESS